MNLYIDSYLLALKLLSRECNFQAVSAETHKEEAIRDAFITGLQAPVIRQRLLENQSLTLDEAVKQARSLDLAQRNAEMYTSPGVGSNFAAAASTPEVAQAQPSTNCSPPRVDSKVTEIATAAATGSSCSFCGRSNHARFKCPARNSFCHKCSKKGHFANVCRSSSSNPKVVSGSATLVSSVTNVDAPAPKCSIMSASVNGMKVSVMVDSGSTNSFMNTRVIESLGLLSA